MNMFAAEINSLSFAFIFTRNDWQLVLHYMLVLLRVATN